MTPQGTPHRYFAMLHSYASCVMMDAKQSVVRVVLHTGRGPLPMGLPGDP